MLMLTQSHAANHGLEYVIFEVVSAFATAGLTLGLTPHLTTFGQLVIMLAMFIGRVGIYTVMFSILNVHDEAAPYRYPEESVVVADAQEDDVLRKLDIASFDHVIIAIGHNMQASILATINAKDLGAKNVIAKAENHTICNTNCQSCFLRSFDQRPQHPQKIGLNVIAVRHANEVIVAPEASYTLQEKDIVSVVGPKDMPTEKKLDTTSEPEPQAPKTWRKTSDANEFFEGYQAAIKALESEGKSASAETLRADKTQLQLDFIDRFEVKHNVKLPNH
ncbi:hypothetical protein Pfo_031594 [Paulownia fortunei]|nr:hypothetical protein Pfo_031594 [Paulownia fortunei]